MLNHLTQLSGVAITLLMLPVSAPAETALERALSGGQGLSAEEIAARIVDHTITARSGDRTFVFYYGADNELTGRMIGGGWNDTGYYGITDDDQVCLSMTPDEGRLRCMRLVSRGDVIQKFDTSGELTFELLSFEKGNKL